MFNGIATGAYFVCALVFGFNSNILGAVLCVAMSLLYCYKLLSQYSEERKHGS